MSMKWSYLAELGTDGALDWGGDNSGNIPVTGKILPDCEDLMLYLAIRSLVNSGAYEGRWVDWGACALKVNGPQLLTILSDCYGDTGKFAPDGLLTKYVAYANTLGADKQVALISVEM